MSDGVSIALRVRTTRSSFAAVAVQAWFSNDNVEIEPGSTIILKLSVQNLGETTENYTIVPSGLTADWVTVQGGNLSLFGGSDDVVDIVIAPPKLPTTPAGPTGVGVRIITSDAPDDTVVAETTVDIQPFDDRRIVALQPVIRSRHRANFEFMVENHGNSLASCRVRLIDPSNRVDGDFDPPAVGVAPGGGSLVQLKAKAKRGLFRRSTRTLDFEVEAEQRGHEPTATGLTFVQPQTLPTQLIGRALALTALLGLAALAWFGVVKPTVEDAAEDRVNERLSQFEEFRDQVADDTNTEVPVSTPEEEEEPNPFVEPGEPLSVRLAVSPAVEDRGDDSYTVPEGQVLDLTDIRVENSNNDAGRAALAVNGDEILVWSLANIRGSLFEPNITQRRLQPGDVVTFGVRCDTVGNGDPSLGTCFDAINLLGRLVEVDDT